MEIELNSISIKCDNVMKIEKGNTFLMQICNYLSVSEPDKKDIVEVQKICKVIIDSIIDENIYFEDEIKSKIFAIINNFNHNTINRNYIWIDDITILDIENGKIKIPSKFEDIYNNAIEQSNINFNNVYSGTIIMCNWTIIDKNHPNIIIKAKSQ